ncbi:MAG: chorismate synthase [Ardenticatenales bacterium]|nr:chorismate synthase [Ardenticatenales bacterium]
MRFLTAGESHGPSLTAILEGMPAGLPIDRAALDALMARRQKGFGSGGRMAIEHDRVRITAGVLGGRTTGAPIALIIDNADHASWAERDIPPLTIPRPGHADLSAAVKYGYRDLRLGLERASARELAARVAVGGVCLQLLLRFGVEIGCYVVQIGGIAVDLPEEEDVESTAESVYRARFAAAEASDVRCPDAAASAAMRAAIQAAARDRDTLGGVFEVVALGVPPGLGSHVHWDRRLTGRLIGAVTSIPAIKGAEIGPAFANAGRRGTEVHDRFALAAGDDDGDDDGGDGALGGVAETGHRRIVRTGGRGGGLEGGITTGAPIVVRGAMKPISTTLTPLASVDLATGAAAETRYERSDICAVPRAAVAAEAVIAFVLADALLEKLGGDSIDELDDRFARLRRNRVADLPMDDVPWRFGYGDEPPGDVR